MALIRICDDAGNVIETHEHKGDFKEWWPFRKTQKRLRACKSCAASAR
jgi:hypothetical protein